MGQGIKDAIRILKDGRSQQ